MVKRRRIAIVGGGTGGHVYPALVIADTYRQISRDIDLLFIGTPNGLESRLIPQHGYQLEMIHGSPLVGMGPGEKVRSLGSLLIGMAQARHLLKAKRIRLVIGFGGYASAGPLLAAKSLGLKTALHEANVVPGLANKLLGRLVHRVYLAFDTASPEFPKSRTLVTGNPIRPEITSVREKKKGFSGPSGSRIRVLVTGGSGGSEFLNENVPELLHKITDHGFVPVALHQAGGLQPERVRFAYSRAGISASVVPYITDMAEAYAWADFAIACSGSQTISELLVCDLPSLVVPLAGSAGNHQVANAITFANAGGGLWVRQEEWEVNSLASQIAFLFRNRQTRADAPEFLTRPAEPDAANKLVADCEDMMKDLW